MTYQEVLENARAVLSKNCKACPVCNGKACGNHIPGPGAKGVGDTAIRNYEKWQDIRVNMNTIHPCVTPDTSLNLFGKTFRYPFFAGPVGAVTVHYSDKYDDMAYNNILVKACADNGIAAFTGDGLNGEVMKVACKAIAASGGTAIPTVKPWNLETIQEKLGYCRESGCFAVAMDIDAAGLPFLKNMNPPAGSKTVEQLKEIALAAGVPFILKGIMTVKGAEKAIEAGAAGIVVSNHGGRVLDDCPATQEVLAVTMAPDKDEVARNNGEQQRAFTWGELWTTRSLWGVLLIRLISDPVWYFCCFWLPGYLRSMGEAQGLSQQATLDMIQYIGGLPFLFGAVGGILTSVWSDWLVRRGMPALKARKTMMILMAFVAPLCILTPYVSEWQAVSFDARIGLVVAIFSLIAIMCLSWLYTICVVIAEAFPVKNVASVVGITAGAGAVGGAVFNIFIGSLLATMGNVLFAVMGVMHLVTAVILWRMVRHETPKNVK